MAPLNINFVYFLLEDPSPEDADLYHAKTVKWTSQQIYKILECSQDEKKKYSMDNKHLILFGVSSIALLTIHETAFSLVQKLDDDLAERFLETMGCTPFGALLGMGCLVDEFIDNPNIVWENRKDLRELQKEHGMPYLPRFFQRILSAKRFSRRNH